ncbi:MAG: hypothetical protein JOZ54_00575, partial [Acidobacteria bacterium]|nr:hypothetical protein [Acidobacteriota bacterium]
MRTLLIATIVATHGCKMPPKEKPARGATQIASVAGKASLPAFVQTSNDDGEWTSVPKDYANTRFSGLADINPSNVAQLKVASTFSTGYVAGHEATPLVVGSTMY